MKCLYCRKETQVVNSRHQKRANQVWRRRRCKVCSNVFTTVETPDFTSSVLFKHNQSKVEPFSRDKLYLSLYESLKHKKNAHNTSTELTNTVIAHLLAKITNATLERDTITETTANILNRFDKAAAIIYRTYHPLG